MGTTLLFLIRVLVLIRFTVVSPLQQLLEGGGQDWFLNY